MFYDLIALLFLLIVLVGGGFSIYGIYSLVQKRRNAAQPGGEGAGESGRPGGIGSAIKGVLTAREMYFLRGLVIVLITCGLLIPLGLVGDLVDGRSDMRYRAINSISESWGGYQLIAGPILVIPYVVEYTDTETTISKKGHEIITEKIRQRNEHLVVLPSVLDFKAELDPQVRYRSIYEHVVYSAPVGISGAFRLPTAEAFGERVARIDWDKAWLALGISDLRGITAESPLVWDGKSGASYSPGTGVRNLIGPGFQTRVELSAKDAGQEKEFSFSVSLNGSGGMSFTPVGEITRISVSGAWPHPNFGGSLLPTKHTITDKGFSAEWSIPHLSRTYPQTGILGKDDFYPDSKSIVKFNTGVSLHETVSLYIQIDRAVKYGLLFIGLTFIALFAFELVTKARLHLVQYALVGVSMTVFYLVLLSLAEHTAFIWAFSAAAAITALMNSLYMGSAMKSVFKGALVAALLGALYSLLYTLLQMEDYTLTIGTAIVVAAMGVLMFLTRNLPVKQSAGAEEKTV